MLSKRATLGICSSCLHEAPVESCVTVRNVDLESVAAESDAEGFVTDLAEG